MSARLLDVNFGPVSTLSVLYQDAIMVVPLVSFIYILVEKSFI